MRTRKLRDAVHGDIQLTDEEIALIDTPEMQRLRGIRQLGAAYYVYPGAQHTRFEHCLGTCWMARQIIARIGEATGRALPDAQRRAVCLAALVHDVTHIPFGHTFEDERRLLERHDRSRARHRILLQEGELGQRLESTDAGRLARRILSPDVETLEEGRCLREIVSGTICADLLDYLKRDNYFCGLRYEFDERVFHYFRLAGGRLALDLHQGGLLRRDALTEITNLLRIRYVLSERVYYHHAKIAAGVMISKAIERAVRAGLSEDELCRLTDDALIFYLQDRFAGDRPLEELLADFCVRRLFKRCYVISRGIGEEQVQRMVRRYHLNEDGARDAVEERIAAGLGEEAHRVAIYCAPPEMALKEADIPVTMPDGEMARLSSLNSEEIRVLKDQHRGLWKLYVFISARAAHRVAEAGEACEEAIGFANELPAEMRGGLV